MDGDAIKKTTILFKYFSMYHNFSNINIFHNLEKKTKYEDYR